MSNSGGYEFKLHFEGASVSGHYIDVEDLASSLTGLNQVLNRLTKVACPAGTKSILKVDANFDRGGVIASLCFDLVTTASSMAPAVVASVPSVVETASSIIELLNQTFTLRKLLKGEDISKASTEDKQDGSVSVAFNGVTVNVDKIVVNYYGNPEFSKPIEKLLNPLIQRKVESMSIEEADGRTITKVSRPEAEDIVRPVNIPQSSIVFPEQWMTVDAVVLTGDGKWKFSMPNASFSARIEDRAFLERVTNREYTFGFGDRILADLRVEMKIQSNRPDYVVTKVYEVNSASGHEQGRLWDDDGMPQ